MPGASNSSSAGRLNDDETEASSLSGSKRQALRQRQSQAAGPRSKNDIEVSTIEVQEAASASGSPLPTPSPSMSTALDSMHGSPGPRPKSTLGLMSVEAGVDRAKSAGQGGEEAEASAARATEKSALPAEEPTQSAAVADSAWATLASSSASSVSSASSSASDSPALLEAVPVTLAPISAHPAPASASTPAPSLPVSSPPGPSSASLAAPTACNPPADDQVLHHQRLDLQDRLQRLSQDPLYYYDPTLLPSPSAHDRHNSGSRVTAPTLHSIFENFSTEPFRKLRPPERYPGEHGNPYTDPRVHPLHAPIHHASSSSSTPATSPPPAPSTSTRSRIQPSQTTSAVAVAAAAESCSEPSSRLPAAPRRSSGSGPAIRRVKTPRKAHFFLDPAPEFDVPSPPTMGNARKIWVRRPGASPTLITISEDDLVDDVRDTILRKYANSLGKTFDAPDLHLRLYPRDQRDRLLQPDEHMCRTLDNFYPEGQTVEDAVVIDIPRRTPKASPYPSQHEHQGRQHHNVPHTAAAIYYTEDGRPLESGEGYFPPVGALPSPHMQLVMPAADHHGGPPHSIAVLGTGHLPTIPSPGGLRPRGHREQTGRPRVARTHTPSSAMNGRDGNYTHDPIGMPPDGMPMLSPGREHMYAASGRIGMASPRLIEARAASTRPKRRKNFDYNGSGVAATVPPISILIVEDNPINLKLLEAFVKRLKVRWQTATNGREAVKKWRTGGFHLVLMDIQLPVMNGLEATREIRRLERVNSIGVFSSVPTTPQEELALELTDKDRLENLHSFKGPVIIVALTASSLQSDRHEALAAGCNDFLTKPVNFVWLERKVTEWGCMQALIDFDGWRAWKDFALAEEEASQKAAALKNKAKKSRSSLVADP
ncbi:response regulator [Cordyceps fumosorosea ARSEF 2679]|uniref:Response regulator n=1 Tax=Cordyceps fumosorosea (strain ARSEF 2679) TaxID=1081104 RepID=A0A167LN69_CORFA|nr:response regulator [Cordyceps fumosorosea ARSEF 2679]OAA53287.1 response regulator [Cordyceps fumosorosea ARSEF 2679]